MGKQFLNCYVCVVFFVFHFNLLFKKIPTSPYTVLWVLCAYTVSVYIFRNMGNGTGTSTFTTNQVQREGATNASFLKHNDNGSVNNLLHEEDSDKEVSDDEESPATFIGLKVEPSAGASVESLEQLKETDKLVDNKSRSPSIDDNLPPPSLSLSENGSQNSVPAINDSNEITEM